jgi:hypothetical protein
MSLPVDDKETPSYADLRDKIKNNELLAAFYQVVAGGVKSEVFQVIESQDDFDMVLMTVQSSGVAWFLAVNESDAREQEQKIKGQSD